MALYSLDFGSLGKMYFSPLYYKGVFAPGVLSYDDIYDAAGNSITVGAYGGLNNLLGIDPTNFIFDKGETYTDETGNIDITITSGDNPYFYYFIDNVNTGGFRYNLIGDIGGDRYYYALSFLIIDDDNNFIILTPGAGVRSTQLTNISIPTQNKIGECEYFGVKIAGTFSVGYQLSYQTEIKSAFKQEPDPYSGGGTSGSGGGMGDDNLISDPIDFPSLPLLSVANTGFISLYNPTLAQIQSLSNYMWSGIFDPNAFKKLFADPMDAILGLSIVPVDVPAGVTDTVMVGNISTGVTMTRAASQYVEVQCGYIDIKELWGAYLDYDPYTKIEIYLPYCGTHALAVDDVMRKRVEVRYHVDILSGACIAYVKCGASVLYSFPGQCSESIPITGQSFASTITGALSIAGQIGSLAGSGGLSAAVPSNIASIASTASSAKPTIQKSGSLSGSGGLMAIQKPYLIMSRPRQAVPGEQNHFIGYPTFVTMTLDDVTGYAEVEAIHLENVPATGDELTEIETILKSGVIF